MNEVAGAASEVLAAASDKVKSAASEVQGEAVEAVQRLADTQKASGARLVRSVARAVEGAADELGNEAPNLAAHVREAGRSLEEVGRDFDQRSVADILHSANDLARRQPVSFMAGAALAGFMLTRFLKSSAPNPMEENVRSSESDGIRKSDRNPNRDGRGGNV
jgi:hypothetical protein